MWYLGNNQGNFLSYEGIQHNTEVNDKRKNEELYTQHFFVIFK